MKHKNIIFDLGAVLFDLNYHKTKSAFIDLGLKNFDSVFSKYKQQHFFDQYERGEISDAQFRSHVKGYLSPEVTDQMIDDAWNAMLIGVPEKRYDWLNNVSDKHRLFLLSNTNGIHIHAVQEFVDKSFGWEKFRSLFENVYLSCELGMRKPEAAIFEHVITENKLNRSDTLFIDDSPQHIEGAKAVGIDAIHLKDDMSVEELYLKLQE